ncbi:MAG: hypothetical protein Q8O95_01435 [bacterium]|nr:hypothetical protein [bacterium]
MKEFCRLIGIVVIIIAYLSGTLAISSIPITHADDAADLENQEQIIEDSELAISNLEKQLADLMEEKAEIEALQSPSTEETALLETINMGIDTTNELLKNHRKNLSAATQSRDDNPEYQKSNLDKQYQELIDATNARKVELEKKTRDYLKCMVGEDDAACATEKTALDDAATAVRKTIRDLTDLEQEINTERTLDVSRVFSLEGREERPNTSISTFLDTIANWMITLVASLAVTTLIVGGFMMVISGGDENRLEMGKTIFEYSIIGLVITLLAYGIVSLIQSVFYAV